MIQEPKSIKSNIEDENIKDALELISSQFKSYSQRSSDLEKLKDLDSDIFTVEEPAGRDKLPSGLPRQIVDKLLSQITIPSASYHCDDDTDFIADVIKKSVEYILDEGGFEEAFLSKPSIARDGFMYGDGFVRVGLDLDSDIPVKFDNINPTTIYVDSNSTVMRSKRGVRAVQKCAIIYSYNYTQARSIYEGNFGKGEIPRQKTETEEFIKTTDQYTEAQDSNVEVCHYFDISDRKNPVHIIFAGDRCTLVEKNEGKQYPFWMTEKETYIPVGQFMCFPSNEGFYNFGILHVFYKYAKIRQQLINKLINQSLNNMSDINVLNVDTGSEGLYIQKIKQAKQIREKGEQPFIINDSGKEIKITQLQREEFNASLEQMYSDLDREIKRWGIDLDSIREGNNATATQIRLEAEAQSEFIQGIVDRNTQFFEFMHIATINLVKNFVKRGNKVTIPINVDVNKVRQVIDNTTGALLGNEVETDAFGMPKKEKYKTITLGDVSELMRTRKIRVEINTKTGVVEKDTLKTARWSEMAQFGANNPAFMKVVSSNIAKANGLTLDDTVWDALVPPAQAPQGQPMSESAQQPNQPQNIPQSALPVM